MVERNCKQAYSESEGGREHITAHIAVSASGYALPPFFIFEKSYSSGPYARNGPDNALYAVSPNGYMDIELFGSWIDKSFIPCTRHIQKSILLILDGHGSHMDIDMIDKLVAHDIHLYCLPPHTTNILQPLDVAIFKPLKTYFSKLTDFVVLASLGEKDKVKICKKNFTAIFKEAYDEKLNVALIKTGFRKCGITPFNPDAIDHKCLMPDNVSEFPSLSGASANVSALSIAYIVRIMTKARVLTSNEHRQLFRERVEKKKQEEEEKEKRKVERERKRKEKEKEKQDKENRPSSSSSVKTKT